MGNEPGSCPACHAPVLSEDWFCGACGARLPGTCPACSHHNPPGRKFCGRCGTSLSAVAASERPSALRHGVPSEYTPAHLAERILKVRSALEGERKPVSVLFCDIVGSTTLASQLGPETMHQL